MPLIYFLRHGQTGWNAEQRVQGHIDAPLNDTGRGQAARNGQALAQVMKDPAVFDYVASPLSRASETMHIVRRELNLEPDHFRRDTRLREIHMGDWQGKRYPDIRRDYPHWIEGRENDPMHYRYPGENSESWHEFNMRVMSWLREIKRDTVVTSHGGVMRCVRAFYMNLTPPDTHKLSVPQDKVLVIADGRLSWL